MSVRPWYYMNEYYVHIEYVFTFKKYICLEHLCERKPVVFCALSFKERSTSAKIPFVLNYTSRND